MRQVLLSQIQPGDFIRHPANEDADSVIVESVQPFHQVVYSMTQCTVPHWLLRCLFPNRYWLEFRDYGTYQIENFISPNCWISRIEAAVEQPF